MRAWFTQLTEALAKSGMGETFLSNLPQPPAAPSSSPLEKDNEDFLWVRRQTEAHQKLRQWQQKLLDAREQQRKANRAIDNVQQHIQHFERKLRAAKDRVETWGEQGKYEEIDWDHDSQADDVEGEEEMSTTEEGSTAFWHKDIPQFQPPSQPAPPTTLPATPFQP